MKEDKQTDGLKQFQKKYKVSAQPEDYIHVGLDSSQQYSTLKQYVDSLLKAEREKAIDECVVVILESTGIPKGAKNPTRDAVVIIGEQLARKLNQLLARKLNQLKEQ